MIISSVLLSLTALPQPELFAGTIWENLDPFGKHGKDDLHRALLSAQGIDDEVDDMSKDRLTLETLVSSRGGNLSAGQRQVIALARAIVRKSRILFMDEATSSIGQ